MYIFAYILGNTSRLFSSTLKSHCICGWSSVLTPTLTLYVHLVLFVDSFSAPLRQMDCKERSNIRDTSSLRGFEVVETIIHCVTDMGESKAFVCVWEPGINCGCQMAHEQNRENDEKTQMVAP